MTQARVCIINKIQAHKKVQAMDKCSLIN